MYMNCASFRKVIVNSRAKQLYMTHAKDTNNFFFLSYYFSQTSIRLTCDDECEPSKTARSDRGKKQFDGTIEIDLQQQQWICSDVQKQTIKRTPAPENKLIFFFGFLLFVRESDMMPDNVGRQTMMMT